MVANLKLIARRDTAVNETVHAALQIVRAGRNHVFGGVEARNVHWVLDHRGNLPATRFHSRNDAPEWNRARRRCELGQAVDQWDDEGGTPLQDRNGPVRSSGALPLDLPKYANDIGVREIRIGAPEFRCIGARPPHDHPHIYLNMGEGREVRCPYCSTTFIHDGRLQQDETEPADCFCGAGSGQARAAPERSGC